MLTRLRLSTFGIWWICFAAIALFMVKVFLLLPEVPDLLIKSDNDDLMRLVQLRDWLAGQSWFDTYQYRVLPPDGISMHWSRYVDAGLAAFYLPLSWVLDDSLAELVAVAVWPVFLGCLAMLVIGHGTYLLFGRAGAVGGLIIFLSWSKLGGEFIPTRIDHHNMQILLATTVFILSVIPGRARLLGALAGAVTALALAVGLEMLPALATIWVCMALRHAFASPTAGDWLLGYCPALAISAPLLLIGQTPVKAWTTPYCDALATPVLALAAVGIVTTLVPVLAARNLKGPLARLGAMVVTGAAGLWLASPFLLPCSAGPYSELPVELRRVIVERIIEARSIFVLLERDIDMLVRVIVPPILIGLMALMAQHRLRHHLTVIQRLALIQALAVVLVGIAFACLQIRASHLITPALPLLAGFLLYGFTLIPRTHRLRAPAALLLILALPATVQTVSSMVTKRLGLPGVELLGEVASKSGRKSKSYSPCREQAAMDEIASLPKSLIFTSMGLGPAILAYTSHEVASAGYHRSPAAFWNGAVAFGNLTDLQKGLASSGADLLVLCVGEPFEQSAGFQSPGSLPDWLVEMTGDRKLVRVFQVDKAALASGVVEQ